VLTRYLPLSAVPCDDTSKTGKEKLPKAEWLDVILYSREQIDKESEAMDKDKAGDGPTTPWGIISIKPQTVPKELPMNPITAMRNAMGREHGGSGREIIREEYMEAVDFWGSNVVVVDK